ncbi:hypothetical protein BpHYR1_011289 [Brachionus plicatilis]|uniref:CRIB domain-containing protein n=1 Tax=Brachionus plicatilis TaxID=10195 RepID=A0A3M7QSH7_BRAPC|nr:hypothetical protein BpHYR1_011289 [Brachionus plicatilis]
MDHSFDKLKNSFDNILKELDDICQSIDNLNDFDQVVSKPPILDKCRTGEKYPKANSRPKNTEPNQNVFRKSRLPGDKNTTPLLSNTIGSAQECTAKLFMNEKNLLPMATKASTSQDQDFCHTESDCKKIEDVDFLEESERLKIASFYSSMNCLVHVSRCTAELYELKRQDEFDSLDTDPVKDYYLFLKNRQKLGDHHTDDESKSIVNFMYINSGVPVLIFNWGLPNYRLRKKDLRVVLAERSTAFCMYEFKFNCLTEFENSDFTSVFRLSQVEPMLAKGPATPINLNYQNEFFEKFFSVKIKPMFKEHFLKFSIRDHLDEFYAKIKNILLDKNNPSYRYTNLGSKSKVNSSTQLDEIGQKPRQSHYKSNHSLNSVTSVIDTYQTVFAKQIASIESPSLVMCHFSVEASVETKTKSGCLRTNSSFASLDAEKLNRSPRLEKQCSLSSNDVTPFKFDRSKYTLRRHNTNATCSAQAKPTLSKSVFNLDDLKFLDNGKNLFRSLLVKNRKLKKSDISEPVNFSHVSHLDKPVAIGKRYKVDY